MPQGLVINHFDTLNQLNLALILCMLAIMQNQCLRNEYQWKIQEGSYSCPIILKPVQGLCILMFADPHPPSFLREWVTGSGWSVYVCSPDTCVIVNDNASFL